METDLIRHEEAGFDATVSKPLVLPNVVATIAKLASISVPDDGSESGGSQT
jgi:hypothetical protein